MSLDLSPREPWVPSACTLPTAERPLRVAEFDDFFRRDVLRFARPSATAIELDLRADPEVASRIAGLASKETGCCSFFTFELVISGGALRLRVSVTEPHGDVLEALADRAQSLVTRSAS